MHSYSASDRAGLSLSADTIVAIATPPGEGGVAILRISGANALAIGNEVFRPARKKGSLVPRRLTYGHVVGRTTQEVIDEVMAVYLPAPHTYTCEDVVELQCHGGRGAPARVLMRVLDTGLARTAQPGEFTKRAFIHGRVDLSEAEAVMELIQARSEASARAASRQLTGGVSTFVSQLRQELRDVLSLVEAQTDFPEEMEEALTTRQVLARCEALQKTLADSCDERRARALREGVAIALVGRPNVGKSSLLNAIAGFDRAIVSPVPGTTRDVLTQRIQWNGLEAEVSDTAGQRSAPDAIERMGVERAVAAQREADAVLLLVDGSAPLCPEDHALLSQADDRTLVVCNKADLPQAVSLQALQEASSAPVVAVSAQTGEGVDEMLAQAFALAGADAERETLLVTQRQILCAKRAQESLLRLSQSVDAGLPLSIVADDLWQALYHLSEITGEDATEDVIDSVFANFCVGK